MNNSKTMPFYMTYPLPMHYEEESKVMQDLEYLQQLYPKEAKKYQKRISSMLDKIDYKESVIYDEFPDRWLLHKMAKNILATLKKEMEDSPNMGDYSDEKWEWISDMIQILLYYEIYKRRCINRKL